MWRLEDGYAITDGDKNIFLTCYEPVVVKELSKVEHVRTIEDMGKLLQSDWDNFLVPDRVVLFC